MPASHIAPHESSHSRVALGRSAECLALIAALLCVAPGCASTLERRELESVARNWTYTVRAGQVVPVYPPSEDVQPGDLFLIQQPIDEQQAVYAERGFLPFDGLLARIVPSGYAAFYAESFGLGARSEPLPETFGRNAGRGWGRAPTAAFPSYAFSVGPEARGGVAIPVSGVPVGMSLLDSVEADGSITMPDVRTYGVDTSSLFADVTRWALDPRNKELLIHYGPVQTKQAGLFSKTQYNHLRIVSRVYLTRRVVVSLRSRGARGDAPDGMAHEGTESADAAPTATTQHEPSIQAMNAGLEAAFEGGQLAPGGTLEVVAASPRTITLNETLLKPLVIGYVGFDMKIFEDGELGPPVPTHAILSGRSDTSDLIYQPHDPTVMCINRWLSVSDRGERTSRTERLRQWWAEKGLPDPDHAATRISTNRYEVARKIFIADAQIDCAESAQLRAK